MRQASDGTDRPWSLAGFRETVRAWAATQPDLVAVLLVGSRAAGTARADSDVDLVLVFESPAARLADVAWVGALGQVCTTRRADFGPVQSLFVRYAAGPEIELGVTGRAWLELVRSDAATRAVVEGGVELWHDPQGEAEAALRG